MQVNSTYARQLLVDRFIVPYERNQHFTGRQHILNRIFEKLCESVPQQHNHRVALYGLGGVGKTQLALEYAYSRRGQYDGVYWISAVDQASILSGLREIAKRTNCLPHMTDIDSSEKAVISWLNRQDSWLLILDNLDDATVVEGLLPDTSPGQHTLLTTRNPNSDEIPAEGLEIGVLDLQEAVDLLYLRSRLTGVNRTRQRQTEAERIVQELGRLPLAIEQAGAYIREVSKDIFKFLPSYRKNRQKYHQRVPRGNWSYQNSVGTTWRLSFDRIEENNVSAVKLLRLLSFLNPDGILTDFLQAGKESLDSDLQTIIADSEIFYEALSELERWSIIRRQHDEEGGERITIHRLVQSVVKDEMSESDFSLFVAAVISLCNCAFPQYGTCKDSRNLCRKFQTQVVIPLLSGIPATKSKAQLDVLGRIGWFLHDDGKYLQSREIKSKAVEVCVLSEGSDHPVTLTAKGRLAVTYSREGRLEEAAKLQAEVLAGMERLIGAEHPDTLTVMSNLALTYLYQGHWDDALTLNQKVLEARTRVLGKEHPDTLTAMSRLAATYRNQKRWDNAISLHEKVLEARTRLLGETHPDTLTAMSSLAYSYIGPKRWDDAMKLLEKVLAERTRLFGEEHMDTLVAMSRLAHTYSGQRRWDKALSLQKKGVYGLTRTRGEDHHDTLKATTWLASTYWEMDQGQRDEAVRLYEKVLEASRRVLGENHPMTLSTAKVLQNISEGHE